MQVRRTSALVSLGWAKERDRALELPEETLFSRKDNSDSTVFPGSIIRTQSAFNIEWRKDYTCLSQARETF